MVAACQHPYHQGSKKTPSPSVEVMVLVMEEEEEKAWVQTLSGLVVKSTMSDAHV
jgi:hypothetical protein